MTLVGQMTPADRHINDQLADVLAALDEIHRPETVRTYTLCDRHREERHDFDDLAACPDCEGGPRAACKACSDD